MKRYLALVMFLVLAVVLASPVSVLAKTKAGVKSGSFFYFFDKTFEKANLFFTFNPEKKAKKALENAEERLAEAEESANENKTEAVVEAMKNYQKNIEVLEKVLNKVPEEAKQATTKAIEADKERQEEMTKKIAEINNEIKNEDNDFKKDEEEKSNDDVGDNESGKEELENQNKDENKKDEQSQEIEKLKKEVGELKKQQSASSELKAKPSQSTQFQNNADSIQKSSDDLESSKNTSTNQEIKTSNSKNFLKAKDLFFLYQDRIKDLENDINSMYNLSESASFKESFDYLKERRQLLLQRQEGANNLRINPEKFSTASTNYYYAQTINETVDEYLNDLNQEIINIDSISRYGNSQIPVFKYHISEYQKKIASLSNDLEKIIPNDEFVKEWETGNKLLMLKWNIAENLNAALKKYLNNVTNWEDLYAFRRKIITNNIVWIGETQIKESQNYSSQLEQEQRLRQQEVDKIMSGIKNMIPKTTRCTIRGDGGVGLEAYVNCYESSF